LINPNKVSSTSAKQGIKTKTSRQGIVAYTTVEVAVGTTTRDELLLGCYPYHFQSQNL